MKRLENKVAIITGSGSGIGAQIAKKFSAEGSKVVIADLNLKAAQQVAEEICLSGGDAIALPLNVSEESSWQQVIDETVQHYGKLNILVNNAGINAKHSVFDETVEGMNKLFGVMVTGPFLGMKLAGPVIKQAGEHGSIVNIASVLGTYTALANTFTYVTAKAAVTGMTKAAAVDFAKMDINVNAVHPGSVATPMSAKMLAEHPEIATMQLRKIPYGRFADPADIAAAVCFLASDEASYIHGASLVVDGGQILGNVEMA